MSDDNVIEAINRRLEEGVSDDIMRLITGSSPKDVANLFITTATDMNLARAILKIAIVAVTTYRRNVEQAFNEAIVTTVILLFTVLSTTPILIIIMQMSLFCLSLPNVFFRLDMGKAIALLTIIELKFR